MSDEASARSSCRGRRCRHRRRGFIGSAVCRALAADGAERGRDRGRPRARGTSCARRAPSPGSPTSATGRDRRGPRRRRARRSTPPPTCASGARWRTSCGSTSGAPRTSSTPPRPPGAERVVHISSVVVYGYADARRPGRGRLPPQRRHPLHRHQERLRRDRRPPRRRRSSGPATSTGPGSIPWTVRPVELMRSGRLALPEPAATGRCCPPTSTTWSTGILLALRRGEPGRPTPSGTATASASATTSTGSPRRSSCASRRSCRRRCCSRVGQAPSSRARTPPRPPPAVRPPRGHLLDRRGTASNERAREELGWAPSVGAATRGSAAAPSGSARRGRRSLARRPLEGEQRPTRRPRRSPAAGRSRRCGCCDR